MNQRNNFDSLGPYVSLVESIRVHVKKVTYRIVHI